LLRDTSGWIDLDGYLGRFLADPAERATARASSFAASLELVRQGEIELRQDQAFGPVLLRRREGQGA
jgi:segregation and condensation protein A